MVAEAAALSHLGATSALPPAGVPRSLGCGVFKASGYAGDE
jgi:hypothetical protein